MGCKRDGQGRKICIIHKQTINSNIVKYILLFTEKLLSMIYNIRIIWIMY